MPPGEDGGHLDEEEDFWAHMDMGALQSDSEPDLDGDVKRTASQIDADRSLAKSQPVHDSASDSDRSDSDSAVDKALFGASSESEPDAHKAVKGSDKKTTSDDDDGMVFDAGLSSDSSSSSDDDLFASDDAPSDLASPEVAGEASGASERKRAPRHSSGHTTSGMGSAIDDRSHDTPFGCYLKKYHPASRVWPCWQATLPPGVTDDSRRRCHTKTLIVSPELRSDEEAVDELLAWLVCFGDV